MKTLSATLSLVLSCMCTAVSAQPAPSSSAPAAAAGIKPGLWETTLVIEDAASTTRRSIVGRVCVLPAEASTVQKILPVQRDRGTQCENRDLRRDGTGWAWAISCQSPEAVQSGTGRLAVSGDGYVGRAELDLHKKGARPIKVKQTFFGKWIQPCN